MTAKCPVLNQFAQTLDDWLGDNIPPPPSSILMLAWWYVLIQSVLYVLVTFKDSI